MSKLNQPFLEIHFLTILLIWDSTWLLYCVPALFALCTLNFVFSQLDNNPEASLEQMLPEEASVLHI